jgi:hypothetical protein
LRRARSAGGGTLLWEEFWDELLAIIATTYDSRELLKMKWPDGATLILFTTRNAGFVVITFEEQQRFTGLSGIERELVAS